MSGEGVAWVLGPFLVPSTVDDFRRFLYACTVKSPRFLWYFVACGILVADSKPGLGETLTRRAVGMVVGVVTCSVPVIVRVGFLRVVLDVLGVTAFGFEDTFVEVLSERFCFTASVVVRSKCLALGVGSPVFAEALPIALLMVVEGTAEAAVVVSLVVLVLLGVDDDVDNFPTIPEKILLVGFLLLGSWL